MSKFTKRTIEALAPRDIDYIAWDREIPGFGVRVMPSGRKSFVLQYRAGRRSRRMVLGASHGYDGSTSLSVMSRRGEAS